MALNGNNNNNNQHDDGGGSSFRRSPSVRVDAYDVGVAGSQPIRMQPLIVSVVGAGRQQVGARRRFNQSTRGACFYVLDFDWPAGLSAGAGLNTTTDETQRLIGQVQ